MMTHLLSYLSVLVLQKHIWKREEWLGVIRLTEHLCRKDSGSTVLQSQAGVVLLSKSTGKQLSLHRNLDLGRSLKGGPAPPGVNSAFRHYSLVWDYQGQHRGGYVAGGGRQKNPSREEFAAQGGRAMSEKVAMTKKKVKFDTVKTEELGESLKYHQTQRKFQNPE